MKYTNAHDLKDNDLYEWKTVLARLGNFATKQLKLELPLMAS